MRPIFFILALALIASACAQSNWYPVKIAPSSELQTDVGGARNTEILAAMQTIPAAETSDDDQIFGTATGALNQTTNLIVTCSGTYSSGFLAQPDVPRNIIGTVNASTTASVKITGTDIANSAISDNLTWSAATGVKASTKAFKTVTRVDADLATGQTAKTLKLGVGDLLGLNTKLSFNSILYTLVNGAKEGTAPTVTTSSTTLSLNTIDTNTVPGGHGTKVYYLVTER